MFVRQLRLSILREMRELEEAILVIVKERGEEKSLYDAEARRKRRRHKGLSGLLWRDGRAVLAYVNRIRKEDRAREDYRVSGDEISPRQKIRGAHQGRRGHAVRAKLRALDVPKHRSHNGNKLPERAARTAFIHPWRREHDPPARN